MGRSSWWAPGGARSVEEGDGGDLGNGSERDGSDRERWSSVV